MVGHGGLGQGRHFGAADREGGCQQHDVIDQTKAYRHVCTSRAGCKVGHGTCMPPPVANNTSCVGDWCTASIVFATCGSIAGAAMPPCRSDAVATVLNVAGECGLCTSGLVQCTRGCLAWRRRAAELDARARVWRVKQVHSLGSTDMPFVGASSDHPQHPHDLLQPLLRLAEGCLYGWCCVWQQDGSLSCHSGGPAW